MLATVETRIERIPLDEVQDTDLSLGGLHDFRFRGIMPTPAPTMGSGRVASTPLQVEIAVIEHLRVLAGNIDPAEFAAWKARTKARVMPHLMATREIERPIDDALNAPPRRATFL